MHCDLRLQAHAEYVIIATDNHQAGCSALLSSCLSTPNTAASTLGVDSSTLGEDGKYSKRSGDILKSELTATFIIKNMRAL